MPFYAVLSYYCDGSGTPFVEFTNSTSELVRILLANSGGGQELTVYEINDDDFGFDVKALSPQTPPTLPTKEPKLDLHDRERRLVLAGLYWLQHTLADRNPMVDLTEQLDVDDSFPNEFVGVLRDLRVDYMAWNELNHLCHKLNTA